MSPNNDPPASRRDSAQKKQLEKLISAGDSAGVLSFVEQLALKHDVALKERDEATKQRNEATKQRNEATKQRNEATKQRDEAVKKCDKIVGRHDELAKAQDDLQCQVAQLELRVKQLLHELYGKRSEKLTREQLGQLVLAFGGTEGNAQSAEPTIPVLTPDDEAIEPTTKKKRKRKHPGRTKLSPKLERQITEVLVPEDERACAHCNEAMCVIGYLEHERVEYVPAKLIVHVERREKLACRSCGDDATTAARQDPPVVPTRVGASFLAHLIESKCDDSLPIHRQADQLARLGFEVPVNTLYGYWSYATQLLVPVAKAVLGTILSGDIVALDDTGLDVLDQGKAKGKYRGHLWCFTSPGPLVAYAFTETWKAEDIAPWLWAAKGFIQCDDYKGYGAMIRGPDGTRAPLVPPDRRLGCMMHVRRRFHSAFKLGDKRAAEPLATIRGLYEVEAEAKALGLDAPGRLELRRNKSLPLLDAFDTWVDQITPKLGKSSPLAKAVRYSNNQRPFIRRCFTDGRFEIDNGHTERQIRKPAVGRRNYLFTGSAKAAERLAAAYTLVQSCRATGISTREYLIDIILKLESNWPMRRLSELLPHHWAEARAQQTDPPAHR